MPQMDAVVDPTLSPPNSRSSPRVYRDEDDEDDNPYASGPRPRMGIRYMAKQISAQGHSTER